MSDTNFSHALVVGASSGIGEALARRLAADGARVALVARREDELRRIMGEINDAAGEERVEARFIVWSRDDALTVPSSALFRREGEWAVFAVEAGEATLRSVEIGQNNGLTAEVLGGLAAGDAVIVHPDDEIADGTAVDTYR